LKSPNLAAGDPKLLSKMSQRIADAVLPWAGGLARSSALLALLIPTLVFGVGVGAVEGEVMGLTGRPQLLILAAMLLAALALAPFATAAALRLALE